jgi:hypothetical protein
VEEFARLQREIKPSKQAVIASHAFKIAYFKHLSALMFSKQPPSAPGT